jgi:hypothetical protein
MAIPAPETAAYCHNVFGNEQPVTGTGELSMPIFMTLRALRSCLDHSARFTVPPWRPEHCEIMTNQGDYSVFYDPCSAPAHFGRLSLIPAGGVFSCYVDKRKQRASRLDLRNPSSGGNLPLLRQITLLRLESRNLHEIQDVPGLCGRMDFKPKGRESARRAA